MVFDSPYEYDCCDFVRIVQSVSSLYLVNLIENMFIIYTGIYIFLFIQVDQ